MSPMGYFSIFQSKGPVAIGSTVNIAARITDLAAAGEIVTTLKTYQRVQHMVAGTAREPTMVKGVSEAVETVQVRGRLLAGEREGVAVGDLGTTSSPGG